MMATRSGKMDRLITIQSKTTEKDEYGEEIETWDTHAKVWAMRRDLRGNEFYAAQQLNAEINTVFKTRYVSGIAPDSHRIVYDGLTYNILAVVELGRREALELMVKARVE